MTRVVVSGAAGSMGTLVADAVEAQPDLELVARYDPAGGDITSPASLPEADVVVEFTRPDVVIVAMQASELPAVCTELLDASPGIVAVGIAADGTRLALHVDGIGRADLINTIRAASPAALAVRWSATP